MHQITGASLAVVDVKLTENPNYRATEMDITMIGLQNAGKTSLLRVLAVRLPKIQIRDMLILTFLRSLGRRIHT